MKALSDNAELYRYLLILSGLLGERGASNLSEVVIHASRFFSGMSTEFLGESRIALNRVAKEEAGALTDQERNDEEHFQCPVKFGARHNLLVFHKSDVDQPFLTHNAELLAIVAPQLEAELTRQLAQRTVKEQVKGILKKLLAGQRPTLKDVARELRLSTRTLQRRLIAERAKFQHLMEEARRELAQHYLLHSSLELNGV